MFYVYILISLKDKKLYLGYTTNIKNRLKKHIKGDILSTKSRRPLKLIYFETYINKEDALRRERYFKTTAGKKAIKYMLRKTLQEFNYSPKLIV